MIIYKTIFPDGKIYIGQDSHNNPLYFGSGKIVKQKIKKYGKYNLKKHILKICSSQKELDFWEEYWIKKMDSCNRNIGYNIISGTANRFGSGSPMKIKEVRDRAVENLKAFYDTEAGIKSRENARLKVMGQRRSVEYRSNQSKILKAFYKTEDGKKATEKTRSKILGVKFTKEHRDKISKSLKGKKFTKERVEAIKERVTQWHKNNKNPMLGRPAWNKGKTTDEKVKVKISNALKGRKLSDSHRKKISQSNKMYATKKYGILILLLFYSSFIFCQSSYPKKYLLDKDTVCVINIEQTKKINKVFIDRDECRELNDSLNSQLENYEDLVRQQDFLIDSKEKELIIEQKINTEKTGIIENQEKELKKTNRKLQWLKIQRTVFGAVAVIATSIIVIQHLDKDE